MPPQLPAAAAYVLAYEALFGQGMREQGPAERAVMRARADMRSELARLISAAGAQVGGCGLRFGWARGGSGGPDGGWGARSWTARVR